MLLDATSPEPPPPPDRKAAPGPDATSSDRDSGAVSAPQSDQANESRGGKPSDTKGNDAAAQDAPGGEGAQHATDADSGAPAQGGENDPDQAKADDGSTDGASPATDSNANAVLLQLGVTIAPVVATATETTQAQSDRVTGDTKTKTSASAVGAFVAATATTENAAQGDAPATTDPEAAASAPAVVPAVTDTVGTSDVPTSPTTGTPSNDDTAPASVPLAFVKAAGLVAAGAPASQSSGSSSTEPKASDPSADKTGQPGNAAPADLLVAATAGQSEAAGADSKDGPGQKGEPAPKKSAPSQPDQTKIQFNPDLAKGVSGATAGAPIDNASATAGTHSQSKPSPAKTEPETDEQQIHRLAASHLPGVDTSPTQAIRPNVLPTAFPTGSENLPASAAAIIANQSVPSSPPVVPSTLAFATPNAIPLAALPVEIAAQAKAGNNRFDIRLDPPELGRIDVRLDIDTKGNVTSRLMVERPETLDLLRRDAPQLERALQDAGLKTSDQGLQFSLRDQSFTRSDRLPSTATYLIPDDDGSASTIIQQGYGQRLGLGAGVDIRV